MPVTGASPTTTASGGPATASSRLSDALIESGYAPEPGRDAVTCDTTGGLSGGANACSAGPVVDGISVGGTRRIRTADCATSWNTGAATTAPQIGVGLSRTTPITSSGASAGTSPMNEAM